MKRKKSHDFYVDLIIILAGIVAVYFLVKTGAVGKIIYSFKDYYILSSFIAGIFFTSTFTVALSAVALGNIGQNAPILWVSLFGALGALLGDLILFFFIRDRFFGDLMKALKPSAVKRIFKSFHFGFLKWLSPILGALIIASPLPDELGLSLLGMSKIRLAVFIPIAFAMNFLGVYLLILFANFIS